MKGSLEAIGNPEEARRQIERAAGRRLNKKERRYLFALVFLARFLAFAIPLWVLLLSGFESYAAEKATAYAVYLLIAALGYPAQFIEHFSPELLVPAIRVGTLTVGIIWDCVGWKSTLAFLALVWAVPGVGNKKRLGALWLVPVLLALNVARLATTIIVGYVWGGLAFDLVHLVLWRYGLLIIIFLLWVWWMKRQGVMEKSAQ